MDVSDQLLSALGQDRSDLLFGYKGREYTRGEIADYVAQVIRLLDEAGAPSDAKVGLVVRNRVLHAAAMTALIAHRRSLTTVYANQSAEGVAAEIAASNFAAVIADAQDWSPPAVAAARASGAAGLVLTHDADGARIGLAPSLERAGPGPFARLEGEQGLEILSSGTTGKPKRILFPSRMLVRAVESLVSNNLGPPQPDVLTWPYGGIGGVCCLVGSLVLGRYTVILEKFNVSEWVEGIRRLKPASANGPPAVARMVLDAKVPPEHIASVKYFSGGGAPMPPDLQTEFEQTYGIKVIWGYGATEFCGTVIAWTPALHEQYGEAKKGAMGVALPGIQVRVVDVDTGAPLPPGEVGYLEAFVPAVKAEWIRTTDLAEVDADGFFFHRGRGDGAIVRGGFKIIPEKIVEALHLHPAVLDAAVVGVPDPRLGETPVAAVELCAGAERPTEADLREHCKRLLVSQYVPSRVIVLDALPRTTSLKADLGAVKAMALETAGVS